jgi:C4-dicarboxylate transporter, DctM subunit
MSTDAVVVEIFSRKKALIWLAGIAAVMVSFTLFGNIGVIFALLAGLMLTGMPISISLGLTVLTFLFFFSNVPTEAVAMKLFTGIEKFEIMAIPFFILAGNFLTHGGVAKRMINFATALVGHFNGGLALGGIVACALFAAVSGSSPATVVAIGSILLPAMVKQGYPMKFGVGVIGTAGGLGILIPPSIVMVIYAVSTNSSIGQLFIAGIIPGILLAMTLMTVTWVVAKKRNYPRLPKASAIDVFKAFRESVWGLFLIVVVIGGIYSGLFTPTEAAAMSAVYAGFVSLVVYRDLGIKDVPKVLLSSASMSAMLLYIITNAVLFSFLLTSEQVPQELTAWMVSLGLSKVTFLIFVNILLLVAGNFMEPSSILLITAPLLFPMAMQLGIDPIHLGVLMTVNMEIGMITPPVGLNLYVASGISRLGLTETTKACAPWILVMLVYLAVITYIPQISLWLPQLLFK